jgi:ABC-2 type transport system ATP-binding protein
MIKIENLTLNAGKFRILTNVNFDIQDGEKLAFIGMNGSGKTTTINSILNFNSNYLGKITIDGYDARDIACHKLLSFCPAEEIKDKIKVYNFLYSFAVLNGIDKSAVVKKINYYINKFEVNPIVLKKKFNHLSSGQIQIIKIITSLLTNAKYIIMDEPANFLDPKIRYILYTIIKKSKKTFLISSHNIPEIKKICNRAVLIDKGQIIYHGS